MTSITDKEREQLLLNDSHLIEFAKIVESYANNSNDGTYANSGPFHAAIVLGNIFRTTKSSIYAFVEDLNGTVTNNPYCAKFFDSLISNHNIEINYILRSIPDKKEVLNKLLNRREQLPDKTKLLVLKHNFEFLKFNFTVSDNIIYRLEKDTQNYIADFSFDDSIKSKKMIDIFNVLSKHDNSKDIVL